MSILLYLMQEFFTEEKWTAILLLIIGIFSNLLQANTISYFTSRILEGIHSNNHATISKYFTYFIWTSVGYGILYYLYRMLQYKILTKMPQWIRFHLLRMILLVNNENLSAINFTKMVSPMNRATYICYQIFSDIMMFILPNILFLLVITGMVFYIDIKMGVAFLLGNITWILYVMYNWNDMVIKSDKYEASVRDTESLLVETMNNVDKIIYRGQTPSEINVFSNKMDNTINVSYAFFSLINDHMTAINYIILFTMVMCISYAIHKYFQGALTPTLFITFFTSMIMYRDRTGGLVAQIPDLLEFIGRTGSTMIYFENLDVDYETVKNKEYITDELEYNNIRFDNVSFTYPETDKLIFENASFKLDTTNNKIIGITGLSGNGKSTMAKMLIKMYKCNQGAVYIDDVNVQDIDTRSLRENVTYVNQNSKLFDKTVLENILYGCNDMDKCKIYYDKIMQYPKIKGLYENVDIEGEKAGFSGEKLSGGQRQIVNVISGLVNPSKILILDEPTNALDPDLKTELLEIIKDFKQHKQCIIIITHDQDVRDLFDENIVV